LQNRNWCALALRRFYEIALRKIRDTVALFKQSSSNRLPSFPTVQMFFHIIKSAKSRHSLPLSPLPSPPLLSNEFKLPCTLINVSGVFASQIAERGFLQKTDRGKCHVARQNKRATIRAISRVLLDKSVV